MLVPSGCYTQIWEDVKAALDPKRDGSNEENHGFPLHSQGLFHRKKNGCSVMICSCHLMQESFPPSSLLLNMSAAEIKAQKRAKTVVWRLS